MYSQSNEEAIILAYFKDFHHQGRVLSIGENEGTFLSNALALIELGWNAVLVEPSPTAFKKLVELHKDRPNVLCYNVAISDFDGEADFYESGEHLGKGDRALLSTLNRMETERWGGSTTFSVMQVPVQSVRTFLTEIPLKTLDFITIDAEGEDFKILDQMDLVKTKTSMVCVEWNGSDLDKFNDRMKKDYFKLYHTTPENLIYISERKRYNHEAL